MRSVTPIARTASSPTLPGIVGTAHRSLPDLVAEELRNRIIDGHLEPGTRLVEHLLASQLDVSRIPLREAIAQLEIEGLVHRLPRRGVVVASMTPSIVSHLFDVRTPLESLAARLAAERADQADLGQLEAVLAAAAKAATTADPSGLARANAAFHSELVRIARNPFLDSFMQPLSSQLRWMFRITGSAHAATLGAEHRAIYQAVREGDAARAARLTEKHIEKTRQPTLDILANQFPDGDQTR